MTGETIMHWNRPTQVGFVWTYDFRQRKVEHQLSRYGQGRESRSPPWPQRDWHQLAPVQSSRLHSHSHMDGARKWLIKYDSLYEEWYRTAKLGVRSPNVDNNILRICYVKKIRATPLLKNLSSLNNKLWRALYSTLQWLWLLFILFNETFP